MKPRDMLALGEAGVAALEAVEEISHVGGKNAEAALAAIRSVLGALRHGFDEKLSPQSVLMHIEQLRDAVSANDATALAELSAKFHR